MLRSETISTAESSNAGDAPGHLAKNGGKSTPQRTATKFASKSGGRAVGQSPLLKGSAAPDARTRDWLEV